MYAVLAIVVQIGLSSIAALAIAPHSISVGATLQSLWSASVASTALSAIGLVATAWYLSRRLRLASGLTVGWLCGLLSSVILALSMEGSYDFSVILYLMLLAPTLLAVLLASVLDRPKSGWQT